MPQFNYDHTRVKVSLNYTSITDFAEPLTIAEDGEDWSLKNGLNNTAQFSKMSNNTCTVTLPMISTSSQYLYIKDLRKADKEAGAGPYPFSFVDLNNGDTIIGLARIMSISARDNAEDATARTVTLRVIKQMDG